MSELPPYDELDDVQPDPEETLQAFQNTLERLDETPSALAQRMQRLGDPRPVGTIMRAIQRMAAGETKVSGELLVVLQMMLRERERAGEEASKLRWLLVGKTYTARFKNFSITLTPQTRGRWHINLTHTPSNYSPDWPNWQSSLEAAKIKSVLTVEDVLRNPAPGIAATIQRSATSCEAPLPDKVPIAAAEILDLAGVMNTAAGQILKVDSTRDADAESARVSIGLSVQAMRLVGEGILIGLGWAVSEVAATRSHDLLTVLRQAEVAIQERHDTRLRPFEHFTLVVPSIDGVDFGSVTIAAYLKMLGDLGRWGFAESYFHLDERRFALPAPVHAFYEMGEQLLLDAQKIVVLL